MQVAGIGKADQYKIEAANATKQGLPKFRRLHAKNDQFLFQHFMLQSPPESPQSDAPLARADCTLLRCALCKPAFVANSSASYSAASSSLHGSKVGPTARADVTLAGVKASAHSGVDVTSAGRTPALLRAEVSAE